jgi:hypothetical protein
MTLLCTQGMNGFHHVGVTGECLEGGCGIGLQPGPSIDRLRLEMGELEPSEVVFQIAPHAFDRVQLGARGREPDVPHMVRPLKPLGGMGAAVRQEQEGEAVGKRGGARVHNDVEGVGIERGPPQEEARAGGRGHGPMDVEPLDGLLDHPHRLDALGGKPASTNCREANAAFVPAQHASRARMVGWKDALQALAAGGLNRGEGLRGFVGEGAAGPYAWR